ncbi:MAG TPA: hypothetical protein VF571_15835 [Pyrinomonadaceae bacterium]|jgi:hypothetical protein
MEFAGGTYISQVEAESPTLACLKWAKNLDTSEIYGLGLKGKGVLIEEMNKKIPEPLNGILNTWFTSALIQGKSAYINFVQTEYKAV